MGEAIRVNFSRPLPVFPLPNVILLPHAVLPLHVFEERYRQMVDQSLDGSGQIALATFAGEESEWRSEYDGTPKLRPIVCVGQIVQHEGLPDGRHNILVHGVCRARILDMAEPEEGRLYRCATLSPIEVPDDDEEPPELDDVREKLRSIMQRDRLRRLRSIETVREWFDRDDIPTHALLELIGFTIVKQHDTQYGLLAEPDARRRAEIIIRELSELECLVRRAEKQKPECWPKGMSWN